MSGRRAAVALFLLALVGIGAATAPALAAAAEVPPGPRIGYLAWFDGYEHPFRVETVGLKGSAPATLLESESGPPDAPQPFTADGLSWSPDGSLLAFTAFLTSTGNTQSIWILPAGGGTPTQVAGSETASHPVFAPDGTTLAVQLRRKGIRTVRGYKGKMIHLKAEYSIWLLGLQGGLQRRLTNWSRRESVPSSFTPDGASLGATLPGRTDFKAVSIPLAGGPAKLIAHQAIDPSFSPDGTSVAFASYNERKYGIYVAKADGSHPRKVSGRPGITPSWDPSGERIAFVVYDGEIGPTSEYGSGGHAYEVNADGSCERKLLGHGTEGIFYPVWQPGPERGAGPIGC